MKQIPLFRPTLTNRDYRVIQKSLKTHQLSHGSNNLKFEKIFSKFIKVKFSISMNSCTSALECALKIIKKKGEVIIPSWTWVSTANAVLNTGNIPVFADVDINSRNINAHEIKKCITKKTIAVIVVHFAGLPCEMDNILKLTKKRKIELIEDSAETLGATWKKKYTGSFGIGCFSFFPTKNITTCEGGMLTTNSMERYIEIKKLIAHGINKSKKKHFWNREADLAGHNYRLPNHLAGLGISQFRQLSKFNKQRRKIAKKYDNFFKELLDKFYVQKVNSNLTHSYQMYSILINSKYRNNLLYYLKKNNIEASVHFDPPLHQQKYLKKYSKKLPNTEKLAKEIITLPIYPRLKQNDLNRIFKVIKNWYKKSKK